LKAFLLKAFLVHVVPKEGRAGGNAPALTGEPLASATARAYRAAPAAPQEARDAALAARTTYASMPATLCRTLLYCI